MCKIFNFLSVGNLKPKLKGFFMLTHKSKPFLLNRAPGEQADGGAGEQAGGAGERGEAAGGRVRANAAAGDRTRTAGRLGAVAAAGAAGPPDTSGNLASASNAISIHDICRAILICFRRFKVWSGVPKERRKRGEMHASSYKLQHVEELRQYLHLLLNDGTLVDA